MSATAKGTLCGDPTRQVNPPSSGQAPSFRAALTGSTASFSSILVHSTQAAVQARRCRHAGDVLNPTSCAVQRTALHTAVASQQCVLQQQPAAPVQLQSTDSVCCAQADVQGALWRGPAAGGPPAAAKPPGGAARYPSHHRPALVHVHVFAWRAGASSAAVPLKRLLSCCKALAASTACKRTAPCVIEGSPVSWLSCHQTPGAQHSTCASVRLLLS